MDAGARTGRLFGESAHAMSCAYVTLAPVRATNANLVWVNYGLFVRFVPFFISVKSSVLVLLAWLYLWAGRQRRLAGPCWNRMQSPRASPTFIRSRGTAGRLKWTCGRTTSQPGTTQTARVEPHLYRLRSVWRDCDSRTRFDIVQCV